LQASIAAVSAAIEACKLRHAGATTEFVADWDQHCRRMKDGQAWIAHAGPQVVLLAACAAGAIAEIAMTAVALPLSAGGVTTEIERCVLRWNRPAPGTVYLLGHAGVHVPDQVVGAMSLVRIPAAPQPAPGGRPA
jgi:hypothetical protein